MKKRLFSLFLVMVLGMSMMLMSCGGDGSVPVTFDLSETEGSAGEVVTVVIDIAGTVDANAYMLHSLEYDKAVLEFVGFANLGDAGSKSIFGDAGFDQKLGTVSIALQESEKLNGTVCEIKFKVKDDAKAGVVEVSMKSVVKNNSAAIKSKVLSGSVTIK